MLRGLIITLATGTESPGFIEITVSRDLDWAKSTKVQYHFLDQWGTWWRRSLWCLQKCCRNLRNRYFKTSGSKKISLVPTNLLKGFHQFLVCVLTLYYKITKWGWQVRSILWKHTCQSDLWTRSFIFLEKRSGLSAISTKHSITIFNKSRYKSFYQGWTRESSRHKRVVGPGKVVWWLF